MNYKYKGVAAELAVAHQLAHRGLGVAWPVGDNEPYDLIVTGLSGSLYRTQVKSAGKTKHGTYKIPFTFGRVNATKYDTSHIEVLIARLPYDEDYEEFHHAGYYIMPIGIINATKGIFYPPGKGRYPQWVSKFEKWREAWEVFE